MLASVPVETAICYHARKENLVVVQATHPALVSTCYKVDASLMLLITANLSAETRACAPLRIDFPALGLAGTYCVTELRAGTDGTCLTRDLGTTSDGMLKPEPFGSWEYRGYRLERTE